MSEAAAPTGAPPDREVAIAPGAPAEPARESASATRSRRRQADSAPGDAGGSETPGPISPGGPGGPGGPGAGPTDVRPQPPPFRWESPGVPEAGSSYMDYLPGVYSSNRFLARFLLIFEAILAPIDRTVENISHAFDPDVAPAAVLPWLGSWLGLAFDEGWPEERRRELIRSAAMLYHWRGTRKGMSEFIRIYTGVVPEIVEPSLGQLANSRDLAFRFTVRLTVPQGTAIDRPLLQRIIDAEKPAFAVGALEVIETPAGTV